MPPLMSACALCCQPEELLNSHIIPEFQYGPLYDEKHRFYVVSANPDEHDRFAQKGFREKLLCEKCETKLSKWEGYARKVIFEDTAHLVSQDATGIRLGGIEYEPFKLYLMSLLWRMSVSKLDFLSLVTLGPYEEKLRVQLANDDPGEPHEYPCLITGVLVDGKFEPSWTSPPDLTRVAHTRCYRCLIAGVIYAFLATDKPIGKVASQIAINKAGDLLLSVKLDAIPFLRQRAARLTQAIKKRDAKWTRHWLPRT